MHQIIEIESVGVLHMLAFGGGHQKCQIKISKESLKYYTSKTLFPQSHSRENVQFEVRGSHLYTKYWARYIDILAFYSEPDY